MKEFKSSSARLARIFKNARDTWKDKALKRQEELRKIYTKVRDLTQSRDNWKERAIRAEHTLKEINSLPNKHEKKDSINRIEIKDEDERISFKQGELIPNDNNLNNEKGSYIQGGFIPSDNSSALIPPTMHHYPVYVIQLGIATSN